MASKLMTPGVYIEEKNAFPSSAVAVGTAIPVFIGYTEKATRAGKSLLHQATKIASFAEYVEIFGAGFKSQFTIVPAAAGDDCFNLNGVDMSVKINDNHTALLFNSMKLFYSNGGSDCYILSVGTYGDKPGGFEIDVEDFVGSATKPNPFSLLEKEYEPTLIVIPDIIGLGAEAAYSVYQQVLNHCAKTQSRFGIFDIANTKTSTTQTITEFREKIGVNNLNYGAAYYPWLKTSIVTPNDVNFENIDASVNLEELLPEPAAKEIVSKFKSIATPNDTDKQNYNQALKAASPTYIHITNEIRSQLNILPPSAALAGIYALVDTARGVWKAPANVSVSMVNTPTINISSEEQESLNVDVMAGKSVNVIRPFIGIGTLVWGARTLDGNSQDWRYINVRRTLIMIEQSLKLASRTYVFEPNDSGTWSTIRTMVNSFLFGLWKVGALAGSAPEQAYDVQVGLGETMTPNDILDGIMRISVRVAIVRTAEFIVIKFQKKQQET
jgi:phage tail sheath protein FI